VSRRPSIELPLPAASETDEAGETLLDVDAIASDLDMPVFLRQQAE
jgi:hypothetical protein